jgi:hypothetical protein
MRLNRPGLLLAWLAIGLAACGKEPFHPLESMLPPIATAVISQYCVRGAVVGDASIDGSIDTNDCHVGPDQGYWEAYRLRARFPGEVSVTVSLGFDTHLELFRVDDLNDYWDARVSLASDLSGPQHAAAFDHDLVPGTEYLIVLAGQDDLSRGSYTLDITWQYPASGS